jgi:hypothetical protein
MAVNITSYTSLLSVHSKRRLKVVRRGIAESGVYDQRGLDPRVSANIDQVREALGLEKVEKAKVVKMVQVPSNTDDTEPDVLPLKDKIDKTPDIPRLQEDSGRKTVIQDVATRPPSENNKTGTNRSSSRTAETDPGS